MKKLIFLSLSILIISFLESCGKKDYTSIEGQVLEKGSNKGIANAKVIFSECVSGDGFGASAICADVETVLTNAQGKYIFTKEKDKATDYRIRAEKTNYGSVYPVYHLANAGERTKNLDFTLSAAAWIKFHVKNVNPFDDSDYIGAPGSLNYADGYYFFGKSIDTTYVLGNKFIGNRYLGNFTNKFYWSVSKNGIKTIYKDSIFIKGLDTVFYEINY